jgi:hypothetical protein
MSSLLNRIPAKVLILIALTILLLGAFFVMPGLFLWGSSREESDFDRQYRENLERSRQDGTFNDPASGAIE